jgi:exonuclease SbcD
VKLLHTSDWHVGKQLRGRSREDEHEAVLTEIATIADAERVDAVLVTGDLFETSAPPPQAEALVYRALLSLAEVAPVCVFAGNHDHPRRLVAVAPLLARAGVRVVGEACRPDAGGVVELDTPGGLARVALLPFLSQRSVVKAHELMHAEAQHHTQEYRTWFKEIVGALTAGFTGDAVEVLCAHAMVDGGLMGGGERSAHTIFHYAVSPHEFPRTLHYVALGHLHRPQAVAGPCPIRYAGSPLQLDFGEGEDDKSVVVVEATPRNPAVVRTVPLTAGRRLRTLSGSFADLEAARGRHPEDHLRIVVTDDRRAGLADLVREWFPNAVDVVVRAPGAVLPTAAVRHDASPRDLFQAYLAHAGETDERLLPAFDALLDDAEEVPA